MMVNPIVEGSMTDEVIGFKVATLRVRPCDFKAKLTWSGAGQSYRSRPDVNHGDSPKTIQPLFQNAVHPGRVGRLFDPKINREIIGAEIADSVVEIDFVAGVTVFGIATEGERSAHFAHVESDIAIQNTVVGPDEVDRIGVGWPPVGQAGAADVVA